MCVIAVVPERVSVNKKTLSDMWEANPDGAGFSYVSGGAVKINKGHRTFESFLDAYSEARASDPDTPYVLHFRIRTHGALDAERTHPFQVGTNKNVALAHNGILSCVPDDPVKSDTQIFCERYPALFDDSNSLRIVREQLGDYIKGNKFAVLFPNKDFVIVNERLGKWVDGCWYSNTYWSYGSHHEYYGRGGY